MNREYHKWWSERLHRNMELLLFGHAGQPVVVFPTSMGKFFEYEDRGMIGALRRPLEEGRLLLLCTDSVDHESWYNCGAHPYHKVRRHVQYESYVLHEVLPLACQRSGRAQVAVTGCSFGGYHAVNFAFRHSDAVSHCLSFSGSYDIHSFLNGFYDNECYFNCPVDYLQNLNDAWYLERFRAMSILLAAGEHDICRGANEHLSGLLHAKGVPHRFDVWGEGAVHDWPLWQRMAAAYFT
jgi:esterase/lipase superfamily enzyme